MSTQAQYARGMAYAKVDAPRVGNCSECWRVAELDRHHDDYAKPWRFGYFADRAISDGIRRTGPHRIETFLQQQSRRRSRRLTKLGPRLAPNADGDRSRMRCGCCVRPATSAGMRFMGGSLGNLVPPNCGGFARTSKPTCERRIQPFGRLYSSSTSPTPPSALGGRRWFPHLGVRRDDSHRELAVRKASILADPAQQLDGLHHPSLH
jgi:hypothetical protein